MFSYFISVLESSRTKHGEKNAVKMTVVDPSGFALLRLYFFLHVSQLCKGYKIVNLRGAPRI